MLVLGLEYLNGWAMATDPADRNRPEWPPHPDRMFMALAAAHFETDGDAEERGILEWLETLGDPELVASTYGSETGERSTVTTYVPPNDFAITKTGKLQKRLQRIRDFDSIEKLKDNGLQVLPAFRSSRQPRTFPVVVLKDSIVSLVWEAETIAEQVDRLNELCRKVTHVGHSASLVRMWATDQLPERQVDGDGNRQWLIPTDSTARYRLRVFGEGSLERLERLCNRAAVEDHAKLSSESDELKALVKESKGDRKKAMKSRQDEIVAILTERYGDNEPQSLRPTPSLWRGYEVKSKLTTDDIDAARSTHWSSDLIVLEILKQGRQRWPLASTQQLTQALRRTAMSHCPDPLPEWLSGHQPDGKQEQGHVAFIPLPHVGARHADGHLLGLGIAVPKAVARGELARCVNRWLFDKSGWAREIHLQLGKLGDCTVRLHERSDFRVALASETWTAIDSPSRRWASVTPIALDRHAKGNEPWEEIADIVGGSCERIGLPRPIDVIPSPVSMFVGAPPSQEMPRIERKRDGGKVRQVHAVITFDGPVVGPVLLGAGRYRGYGLCRPLTGKELE